MQKIGISSIVVLVLLALFVEIYARVGSNVPVYHYKIIHKYAIPHNTFLEGLVKDGNQFILSSGHYGRSKLMIIDAHTGSIVKQVALPRHYFAEGITMLDNKIYQLTYLSNKVLVYNKKLKLINSFNIPFQGWGLTTDGRSLIMSNGTSALIYISPSTHKVIRFITLTLPQSAITHLNDLQFHNDKIYANVFQTNLIVIASASNGEVVGWINIAGINKEDNHLKSGCVANGIAFNNLTQHMIVGGKCWTHLYEITSRRH